MQELIERKLISESLQKAVCPKCHVSLEGAEVYTITQAPTSLIAHATCANCKTSTMITITATGAGLVPIRSDLEGNEFKKFMDLPAINYDEVLDLHKELEKNNIWSLLEKK